MKHISTIVKLGFVLGMAISLTACFDNDDDPVEMEMPENRAPIATASDFTTQTEVAIQANLMASDPDGDTLSFSLQESPMLGEITVNSDGSFSYQPSLELTGSDSFSFMVTDSQGASAVGQVNITIEQLTLSLSQSVRGSFQAQSADEPIRLNGREFIQDAESPTEFQDLIDGN